MWEHSHTENIYSLYLMMYLHVLNNIALTYIKTFKKLLTSKLVFK